MKILLITRGYPQKHNKMLGVFEKDQALALKKNGHEVAYGVVDIRSVLNRRKFGYNHFLDENGLEIFEMNWPIGPMPRFMIEFFRQEAAVELYKHIIQDFGRPDIVHAHFLNYGVISVKLCRKENLPLVITEHSSYLNTDKISSSVYSRAIKAYSASDAIIAVSDALAERIESLTGFKSITIGNIAGIDNLDKKVFKRTYEDCFRFASAGRLVKEKGFDLLIKAFGKVCKLYPKSHLTILGSGPYKRALIRLVEKLGIADFVSFYGKYSKDELPEIYKQVDAFVLASRGETFGVVYIEAMAMGIPVIATACGGPETFVNDEVGYLVKKDDVNALTNAMVRMVENRDDFNDEYIKNYVNEKFSSNVIAEEITRVYQRVLSKRGVER